MSKIIVNTGIKVRGMLLHKVASISEELFDVQPPAFNNTIRWNIGHMITSLDGMLSLVGVSLNTNLPESYEALFAMGSKPSEWSSTVPSKDELVTYLNKQLSAISELSEEGFTNVLETPIQMGPMTFETVGELVNFAFIHETMHLDTINSLLKVISHDC